MTASISPPLGVISDEDQSGLILVMAALSACFVLVSLVIRLFVRNPAKGLWKWDDHILATATILSCVQSALVLYEVHIGLGKSSFTKAGNRDSGLLRKYHYANNYLYILVLLFSKLSVGFLYLRLTKAREFVIAVWLNQALCTIWAALSVVLISVGISWQMAFSVMFSRWVAVGVIDCLTETVPVSMSIYLVHTLQLSMAQKTAVVCAFSARLLTIPACAVRLHFLNPSTLSSKRSFAISMAVVLTQIQLAYGILAASITVLRPFVVVYEKPITNAYNNSSQGRYNSTSESGRQYVQLERIQSTRGGADRTSGLGIGFGGGSRFGEGKDFDDGTRVNRYAAVAASSSHKGERCEHGESQPRSIHKGNYQTMTIERRMDWCVQYEE